MPDANGVVWFAMVKLLEQAIAEAASLPAADQEQIGRSLLSHIERLRKLRTEIDKGLRSLDAGEGRPLDIEEFIQESIEKHGRS
jgi:alcohol dehydrogenase class IV